MIANSSTLAFPLPDSSQAVSPTSRSDSPREEKAPSFDSVLGQAHSQRTAEDMAGDTANLRCAISRPASSSPKPDESADRAEAEAPSTEETSGDAARSPVSPDCAPQEEAKTETKPVGKKSSARGTEPPTVPVQDVSAVITLACLAQAPIPAPAVPAAAISQVDAASLAAGTPLVAATPIAGVNAETKATVIAVIQPTENPVKAAASASMVPPAAAVVQSPEKLAAASIADSSPPAANLPLISSGIPTDSRSGIVAGPGVDAALDPSQTAAVVNSLLPDAPAMAASTQAVSPASVSPSPASPVPDSAAGTVQVVLAKTNQGTVLVAKAATDPPNPTLILPQPGQAVTGNGSKQDSIERMLVIKEPPKAQPVTRTQDIPAAPNTPATLPADALVQPSKPLVAVSSALAQGALNPPAIKTVSGDALKTVNGTGETTAKTMQPDNPAASASIAPAAADTAPALANAIQTAASKTAPAKAGEMDSPVAAFHSASATADIRTDSLENTGSDTSGERQQQQKSEQTVPTAASTEPPSAASHAFNAPAAGTSISTVSTTETAAPGQNVDRYHAAEQITRHLDSLHLPNGNGEMTLRLAPEHLGSVRVTISTQEHGVAARILVETSQAHQAVSSAKEQLRSALEARGLHLSSLDVSLGQNAQGDNFGSFARQQERAQEYSDRRSGQAYGRVRSSETALEASVPATAKSRIQSIGSSRLDYRA